MHLLWFSDTAEHHFVIHTTCMDQATLLACHIIAFAYFGGVPKEILYDNIENGLYM